MNRFICDGHEYRVSERGDIGGQFDLHDLKNNYGTVVASMYRSPCGEYWQFTTVVGGADLGRIHENALPDNVLNQELVHRYVAWAWDNDTVEEHY